MKLAGFRGKQGWLTWRLSSSVVAGIMFLVWALLTRNHYGLGWDNPVHFKVIDLTLE